MNHLRQAFGPALLASLLAGCASSPSVAPVLLTLPTAAALTVNASTVNASTVNAGAEPNAAGNAPLLAVRRVGIPEYLIARRVRYRAEASLLAEWPNTYWAERIEIGVSREFVNALRRQLPGWALCDTDCGDKAPAFTLQVDLVPMDYVRSAKQLDARARITLSSAGPAPQVLLAREFAYDIAVATDTPQGQAEAMARVIQQAAAAAAPLIRATRP